MALSVPSDITPEVMGKCFITIEEKIREYGKDRGEAAANDWIVTNMYPVVADIDKYDVAAKELGIPLEILLSSSKKDELMSEFQTKRLNKMEKMLKDEIGIDRNEFYTLLYLSTMTRGNKNA